MEFAILKTMKRSYIYIYKHANFAHWTKYVRINTARLYLGLRFWGESISQKSGILSTEEGTFNTNAKCCIQFCQKRGWDSAPTFSKSLGASSPIERLYWKYIHLKAKDNSHVMHQYDKNLHLLSNLKMCYTMCQLCNSSIPHQIMKTKVFLIFYWGLLGFLEKKKVWILIPIYRVFKTSSNVSLTNTSKYHNIHYKWPEYFIEMDIN